jgi:predicted RNA binding protein YcfA (HicA-like mRNA interferase family)
MTSYTRELKKLLRDAGCRPVRHGKGDHEIWQSPNGKRFPVDSKILSRELANTVLKQAGLQKRF